MSLGVLVKTCLDLTPRRNSNLGTLSVTERRREDQPQPSALTAWYVSESHGCRYLFSLVPEIHSTVLYCKLVCLSLGGLALGQAPPMCLTLIQV